MADEKKRAVHAAKERQILHDGSTGRWILRGLRLERG